MTLRRLHVPLLHDGTVLLDAAQAHHARHVLRLSDGSVVEVFDDRGNAGMGILTYPDDQQAMVRVEGPLRRPDGQHMRVSVASAVPKSERADWLVEKLSELGVFRWIPLATERSVVLPTGAGKRQRWQRIATESAKQSRRTGVMAIDELTPLATVVVQASAAGWMLSTAAHAEPIGHRMLLPIPEALTLFIGPEGGWTDRELHQFSELGIPAVGLGETVLRVETAAIVAAAVILMTTV